MNRYPGLMTPREVDAMRHATAAAGIFGDLADDVHQEAALKLWRTGAHGGPAAYTAASSCAVDLLRGMYGQRTRREYVALDPAMPSQEDTEAAARVSECVRRLPRADAALAEVLAATEDGDEAAALLGVKPTRVSQRKHSLRAALARFI